MPTLPYEEAFNRIRIEFLEMPGMRLTPEQVERLCGVSPTICKRVLDDLVRAGFLRWSDGSYGRSFETGSLASGLKPRPLPVRLSPLPAHGRGGE